MTIERYRYEVDAAMIDDSEIDGEEFCGVLQDLLDEQENAYPIEVVWIADSENGAGMNNDGDPAWEIVEAQVGDVWNTALDMCSDG